MLDPEAAEDFLEDYSTKAAEPVKRSRVDRVDDFFARAECAVESSRSRLGDFLRGVRDKLFSWRRKKVEGRRIVRFNDEGASKGFAGNFVSTGKYHWHNAVFKFLYEQLALRIANTYFIFVGILFTIDAVSPVQSFSRYGQLIAVIFIMTVSLIKEALEDSRRHIEDRRINRMKTFVLGPKGETRWAHVRVGDIVKVCKDEAIPADLVLLFAGSEDGLAYVETKQLDGESNLKVKSSLREVSERFSTPESALQVAGHIESEAPNPKLNDYNATITLLNAGENLPASPRRSASTADKESPNVSCMKHLRLENLLVRGSRLRNTPYVFAIAVNTGKDTKLVRNLSKAPKKISSTESKVNFLLLCPIILQVLIITTLTVLNAINCRRFARSFYLGATDETCSSVNLFVRFFTFFCTFANLLPIALYVSIEIVRGLQVYFMTADDALVTYVNGEPIRLNVRASNLTDELGVITHIFSDKTGTLTANDMVFKKCFTGKSIFEMSSASTPSKDTQPMSSLGTALDPSLQADSPRSDPQRVEAYRGFAYLLALCHTVVADGDEYQAASPDELALVYAARDIGYVFKGRSNQGIFLEVFGQGEQWEQLAILDFTSDRKRMSMIVRSPHDGQIYVYTKGADSVMFGRCHQYGVTKEADTQHALNVFACDGLRTLCVGYRHISEDFFNDWSDRWAAAINSDDRAERCMKLSDEVENDLTLLGCTAIEDRLQDGVPDTLQDLELANIKLWVLTGDKQETAINVGLSCGVIDESMDVVVVNEVSEEEAEAQIDKAFGRWGFLLKNGQSARDFGLVIDGGTLEHVLAQPRVEKKLVLLSRMVKTVIGCRVTPKQKSDVLKMVRRHEKDAVTLAVGDGANDVAMIQTAHVGIGIVGVEGLEAKLASDFAIGQFKCLGRLILVHGRWCYKRIARVICYIIYKNILFVSNDFYFAFSNGFSGQPLIDPWITALYNVLVTSLPIIAVGSYDTDVAARYALEFPEIYRRTQARTALRITVFVKWVITGMWQGAVIYWFTRLTTREDFISRTGQDLGFYAYGAMVFTQIVVVSHAVLLIYCASWNSFTLGVMLVSLSIWFWVGPILSSDRIAYHVGLSPTLLGVIPKVLGQPITWLIVALTVTTCVIPGHVMKYWMRNYRATNRVLVQELMKRRLTREDVFGARLKAKGENLPTFTRRDLELPFTTYVFDALQRDDPMLQPFDNVPGTRRRLSDTAIQDRVKETKPKITHRRLKSEVPVDTMGMTADMLLEREDDLNSRRSS